MPSLQRAISTTLFDQSIRTATLAGAASIPFSLFLTLYLGSESVTLTPMGIAALVIGYHYEGRSVSSRRAGLQTGLVGGVPVLLESLTILEALQSAQQHSTVLVAVFVPLGVVLTLGIAGLLGAFCGMIGGIVANKLSYFR